MENKNFRNIKYTQKSTSVKVSCEDPYFEN